MDDMTMMSVQCNIILDNGYMCGLPPIGRCATCQRAFCASHQAYLRVDYFGQPIPSIGLCVQCANEQQEKERKRQAKAQAPYEYFKSGAARTALLTASVLPVDIYEVSQKWETKKGLFSALRYASRSGYVDVATPVGRGWILGEFKWEYIYGPYEGTKVVEDCLTALLDISRDDQLWDRTNQLYNNGLARVQPYSGGYRILGGRFIAYADSGGGWREAMQAVKRLAGESS